MSEDFHSIDSCMVSGVKDIGESPAMLKKDGMYYWLSSHTTSWERNDNMYSKSASIFGPWTDQGLFCPEGSLTYNTQCSYVLPVGDDCGTVFTRIEVDSYEAGGQEWTKLLPDEFLARKGYDIIKWLPAIAGEEIDGADGTKRFVNDWKDVIRSLMAENYYGHMSELVHRVPGMRLLAQPYGSGSQKPFGIVDTRKALAQISQDDHICVEFWTNPVSWGWPQVPDQVDKIRDAGHDIIFSEGFTCWPLNAWKDNPNSLKIIADKAFCHGINSMMLHAGAQNPWPEVQPGMTMGMWGTQWTPGQTWWKSGGAKSLFSYMAHCQALLQKGTCVDDFRSQRGSLLADTDSLEWTHRVFGDENIYFVSNVSESGCSPIIILKL